MITPATQDAAYRMGWALKRAGVDLKQPELQDALRAGHDAFTDEAEAERHAIAADGVFWEGDNSIAAGWRAGEAGTGWAEVLNG